MEVFAMVLIGLYVLGIIIWPFAIGSERTTGDCALNTAIALGTILFLVLYLIGC